MKLAIVGSTQLRGDIRARRLIEAVLDRYEPKEVVTGGAIGVDTMAIVAAKKRGIPCKVFWPDVRRWDGGDKIGFKQRNLMIAERCDKLVRIVSQESVTYGSGWTRDRAKALGKFTREFRL